MSLRASCFNLSRRTLEKIPSGSCLAPARTALAWRRHQHGSAAKATKEDEEDSRWRPSRRTSSGPRPTATTSRPRTEYSTGHLTEHLNKVFAPLDFPHDLARRLLTHQHHADANSGHNGRFAFLGRRVIEMYTMLFLDSVPPSLLPPGLEFDVTAAQMLKTHLLGEHVARDWNIWTELRWVPNLPRPVGARRDRETDGQDREAEQEEFRRQLATLEGVERAKMMRYVGLYKVAGLAVEAIAGGIYHQFGGTVAHRIFHTRILPHLLLPGSTEGLPDSLHSYAIEISEKLGGSPTPEPTLPTPILPKHGPSVLESVSESVEEDGPSPAEEAYAPPSPLPPRPPTKESRKGDPIV
ncbi:hypothetical protein OE88DRAFT_1633124 [Heliocybe sulcata]|uniref:RNase III domain-containing protein n=1 Tax=Heliocybe sulcata TaxID=5364 RepID=A0A5C3MZ57_9AGAM|nr:hypothetical protein OE88DRAFT_1633124 [Heliocybe sulcata]